MAREIHAIVNPVSGNGRAGRRWPAVARQLRALGIEVQEHRTRGPGDATVIAARLVTDGAREIAVVGGDGTVNETVNGLFADRAPGSEACENDGPVLSLLPCGTGRDFARSLGIRDLEQAVAVLTHEEPCAVDVGRISYHLDGPEGGRRDRYFVNVADVGLGAETAAYINRTSKALGAFFAYFVGAARTIVVFRGRTARVVVDGETVHDGPLSMVVLANGRFHAGGMDITPMASLTDGKLEILVLRDVSKPTLLCSLLPRVYRGKHIGHPAVRHLQGRVVEVSGDEALLFEADGEQPGTTDLTATVVPAALRVRVPRASARPRAALSDAGTVRAQAATRPPS